MDLVLEEQMNKKLFVCIFIIIIAVISSFTDESSDIRNTSDIIRYVLILLNDGKQSEAEKLLIASIKKNPENQELLFYSASCTRSRFEIEEAYKLFNFVYFINEESLYGKISQIIMNLDKKENIEDNFSLLEQIVEQNPDNIIIRWMLAVQCRNFNYNEKGDTQYQIILQNWNPGPVLVHQTYANILDALEKYDEALIHRNLAVKLEPEGWSYHGLSVTLFNLGRYQEAKEAVLKAIELAPNDNKYKNFLKKINSIIKNKIKHIRYSTADNKKFLVAFEYSLHQIAGDCG
jgi:tetratricopeptide (TPR) repeat protein